MPYDCFISYSSTDLKYAEALYEALISNNFTVWFDKARLSPGCNWYSEIEQGCENSRVFLPILSKSWKTSKWTKYETYGAEGIIPLVFDDWEDVRTPPLERFQADLIDCTSGDESIDWTKVFTSVRKLLERPIPQKSERITKLEYGVNNYFVGRERELICIHEELHCNPRAVLTQGRVRAITAMGGVGKTTIVRQYAEKFWRFYPEIFWVDSRKGYCVEFAQIYDLLFPDRTQIGLKDSEKAEIALNKLNEQGIRLLIIDNAEDEESAMSWVPKSGGCHTIITSRYSHWSAAVKSIHLFVLEKEPAVMFLRKRAAGITSDEELQAFSGSGEEVNACEDLAEKLGYLPLAMEQAAAYIHQQGEGFGFVDYLEEYEESTQELLDIKALGSTEYPDSVITTWKPSMEKIYPGARAILRLSSFLAPKPIAISMFINAIDVIYSVSLNFAKDAKLEKPTKAKRWIREQLNNLADYSLVKLEGHSILFHPLLLTVEYVTLPENDKRLTFDFTTQLLCVGMPEPIWKEGRLSHWSLDVKNTWDQILYHVKHLHELGPKITGNVFSQSFQLLMTDAYASAGEHASVLSVCERLCEQFLGKYGDAHPLYLQAKESLGYLQMVLKKYNEALETFQTLHELLVETKGKDHIDTLKTLHNVAQILFYIHGADKAEPVMRKVLERRNLILAENHYDIATSMNDLGYILMNVKDREDESEKLLRKALDYDKVNLCPAHPDTRAATTNLASFYRHKFDFVQAETLQKAILEDTALVLGDNHLDCFGLKHDLSLFIYNNGRHEEALDLISEVVEGYRRYLPPDHRDMLTAVQDLGTILGQVGRHEEAEPLLRDALAGYERTQGTNSTDTARTMVNLASLLMIRGKNEEAYDLLQRGIDIKRSNKDSSNDPDLAVNMNQLSIFKRDAGSFEEAEKLLQDALEVEKKAYPADHPKLPHRMNNLSLVLMLQGKLKESEELNQEAYRINGACGDVTTARLLYSRCILCFLNNEPFALTIGQIKTVMDNKSIEAKANITAKWEFNKSLEFFVPSLSAEQMEFLRTLLEVYNDQSKIAELDRFEFWKNQEAVPLNSV